MLEVSLAACLFKDYILALSDKFSWVACFLKPISNWRTLSIYRSSSFAVLLLDTYSVWV